MTITASVSRTKRGLPKTAAVAIAGAGLTTGPHPISYLRDQLRRHRVLPAGDALAGYGNAGLLTIAVLFVVIGVGLQLAAG